MKTKQPTKKPSNRSSRSRRSRKKKSVAGGIFIEVLGFVGMILLFVFARTMADTGTQTIAEPTATMNASRLNEPEFQPAPEFQRESELQSQPTDLANAPQRENTRSRRPFRVRFDTGALRR